MQLRTEISSMYLVDLVGRLDWLTKEMYLVFDQGELVVDWLFAAI